MKTKHWKNNIKNAIRVFLKETPKHLLAAGAVCIVLAVALLISTVAMQQPTKGEFIPPAFETAAVTGTPEVPEQLVYKELYQAGMHFCAWVCVAPIQQDGEALVYFTNPASNDVWMKLRILGADGETVGESGLLRPGEYVESVKLTQALAEGAAIHLKIMTYEPETYFSMGSVGVNTTLGK